MHTLRKSGGLSGFAKRKESEYDKFGAGHSSTSISAALGMAVGTELQGLERNSIAVIGDGAITGGMAYEAMNNAPYLNSRVIVIYNDNGQVSLPTGTPTAAGTAPAGSLSAYTSRLLATKEFKDFRDVAKSINKLFPKELQQVSCRPPGGADGGSGGAARPSPALSRSPPLTPLLLLPLVQVNARIDEYARGMVSGGTLFEELGFYYIGPVDGHDMDNLVPILENIRDRGGNQPVLLHVKTKKGFGYPPAEQASDKYHGVPRFDVATGKKARALAPPPAPSPPPPPHLPSPLTPTRLPPPRRARPRALRRTPPSSPTRSSTSPPTTARWWRSPRRCRAAPASTASANASPSGRMTSGLRSSTR